MKVLRELDFNARQPIAQIAKKTGLSKEAAHYRIKQLEQKGIITNYYTVIDLSKIGYLFCRLRYELEKVDPKIEERFLDYSRHMPNIGWFIVRGNMNIGLIVYAKSVFEAKEIMDKITNKFYTVVKSRTPSIATKIYHFRRNYLYNTKEDDYLLWGEGKKVDIDETDKKILILLTHDARLPYTKIAEKVGLTSMAVMNRVKRMEKEKLILGYRCALNLQKLGYTHQKIILYMENISAERKKTLLQYLRICPSIVYITEVLDGCDLEFELHLKSSDQLYTFMKKLREVFPEIKSFDSYPFYREEIIRYIPESFETISRKTSPL